MIRAYRYDGGEGDEVAADSIRFELISGDVIDVRVDDDEGILRVSNVGARMSSGLVVRPLASNVVTIGPDS